MFEDQTFEAILERLLERVPDTLDKREGSIVWNALAPAAAELAQIYINLDLTTSLGFGQTTSGEYLDRRAAEHGIYRNPATPAIRKGLFYDNEDNPFDVPIGSRFSCDQVNFVVIRKIAEGEFELEAEEAGRIGNEVFGALIPIENINGLARAELTDVLVHGQDEEDDESLRARYLQKVRESGTSGNVADYKRWATEVPGVGGAKVVPLWDGPGTVKVVIVDAEKKPAPPDLVNAVYEHIESVRPIGASVTVASATGKSINISATVTLASGYPLQAVQDEFERLVEQYLQEIAFEETYVSYARIGTILLKTPGVIDYTDLLVNGGTANVELEDEEVPVLGTVTLEV